jgi:hypothetical protein
MAPKKGQVNNPKGKPVGTKCKKTLDWEAMRDKMTGTFTDRSIEYIENLWKVDPDKAFDAYLKLIEYFKPKQQRTDLTTNGKDLVTGQPIVVRSEEEAEKIKKLINGAE